jgi:hypothetical protein
MTRNRHASPNKLTAAAGAVRLQLWIEWLECAATEIRLAMRASGEEVPAWAYTPTPRDITRSIQFAQRRRDLVSDLVSRCEATRGASRERRPSSAPRRRARAGVSRDGPLPSNDDDDPPEPLDLLDAIAFGLGRARVA